MLTADHCAFLFPGQGSQALGMGAELAQTEALAQETFLLADTILGDKLSEIAWQGPQERLDDTINTQPALLVHSVAALRVFQQRFPTFRPAYTAGHSMGQISALVASHALPFEAALPLVRVRGEAMQRAGGIAPGGMAAILGLDIPTLEQVCQQASQPGEIVQVANDNCPGQVVISGAAAALQRALQLATEAGARRAVPLAVSIAAHSELMIPAQDQFNLAVQRAPFTTPDIPVVGNVSASPLDSVAAIRSDLNAQLTSRVRWTESIQWMVAQGITTFIEIGSGNVLTGLLRRIDRSVQGYTLGTPQDFDRLEEYLS
jgi:[acyl-carrier-protein] S-malonyltransferase